jgi:putative endonuclease
MLSRMHEPHDFGRLCEDLACRHLARRGWRIIHRNFRLGHKEIDIVARCGGTIAFIEVKGRRGTDFGHPLDAVTHAKRAEIERVARFWISRHGRSGDSYRFDAIAVLSGHGRSALEHVEDAWRL